MGAALAKGEIVVSRPENRDAIKRAHASGRLVRLARGIYTSAVGEDPEVVVRRNVWAITAELLPGALIADRTAMESRPAIDGSVFLVADRVSAIELPGIALRPRRGVGPLREVDPPFMGGLWMSSQARALLENMRPTRSRNHIARTLSRSEIEGWMDRLLRREAGDAKLNALRDHARRIAPHLGMEAEADDLSALVSAMLGTRDIPLSSEAGRARAAGMGFDPERLALLEELRANLAVHHFPEHLSRPGQTFLPFFEAYFSNFIEGTEFEISEAFSIVFDGVIPQERPEDAHDILGTFRLVSDEAEMAHIPATAEAFLATLRHRHAVIMEGRPGSRPGEFKLSANRAGQSIFVSPDLVAGTLLRAFPMLRSLECPMARAVFVAFLVAEVHPFADGNGRVARAMMNAELVAAHQQRIIIPSSFRTEYLQALRALTHNNRAAALIDVLGFAQHYTSKVEFGDFEQACATLERTNAHLELATMPNLS